MRHTTASPDVSTPEYGARFDTVAGVTAAMVAAMVAPFVVASSPAVAGATVPFVAAAVAAR